MARSTTSGVFSAMALFTREEEGQVAAEAEVSFYEVELFLPIDCITLNQVKQVKIR